MHIGTGKFEGKRLKDTHEGAPLSTRVLTMKESVFEIIGVRIHGSSVLDVNDANGMYGIEAISKGATIVQFLNLYEKDTKLVRENLETVGLNPEEFIIAGESPESFFSRKTDARYDIIFFRAIDKRCLEMVEKVLNLQNEKGTTIIMYPDNKDCKIDKIPNGYQVIDSRSVETDRFLVLLREK